MNNIEDKFQSDFNNWLFENHRSTTPYELFVNMKHVYLSLFLDLNERPNVLAVGEKARVAEFRRTELEVNEMVKFYNKNYDTLDLDL